MLCKAGTVDTTWGMHPIHDRVQIWNTLRQVLSTCRCRFISTRLPSWFAQDCHTPEYVPKTRQLDHNYPPYQAGECVANTHIKRYTWYIITIVLSCQYNCDDIEMWLEAGVSFLWMTTHLTCKSTHGCVVPHLIKERHSVLHHTVPNSPHARA